MIKAFTAAGLALAAASSCAFAAPPGFCENYAIAAVRQAEVAHHTPACAPGAFGDRWSVDRRVHYSWCITAPPVAAEQERELRTRYLRNCRGV